MENVRLIMSLFVRNHRAEVAPSQQVEVEQLKREVDHLKWENGILHKCREADQKYLAKSLTMVGTALEALRRRIERLEEKQPPVGG
jgi:hypothetical protein